MGSDQILGWASRVLISPLNVITLVVLHFVDSYLTITLGRLLMQRKNATAMNRFYRTIIYLAILGIVFIELPKLMQKIAPTLSSWAAMPTLEEAAYRESTAKKELLQTSIEHTILKQEHALLTSSLAKYTELNVEGVTEQLSRKLKFDTDLKRLDFLRKRVRLLESAYSDRRQKESSDSTVDNSNAAYLERVNFLLFGRCPTGTLLYPKTETGRPMRWGWCFERSLEIAQLRYYNLQQNIAINLPFTLKDVQIAEDQGKNAMLLLYPVDEPTIGDASWYIKKATIGANGEFIGLETLDMGTYIRAAKHQLVNVSSHENGESMVSIRLKDWADRLAQDRQQEQSWQALLCQMQPLQICVELILRKEGGVGRNAYVKQSQVNTRFNEGDFASPVTQELLYLHREGEQEIVKNPEILDDLGLLYFESFRWFK